MAHALFRRRVTADHHGDHRLAEAAHRLGQGVLLVAADLAAIEHGIGAIVMGERFEVLVRISSDHRVAADMGDQALADAGRRQLPRHRQRQRSAARDQREPAGLAEARRDRAEQAAARHVHAKRVRAQEPASARPHARHHRQRIVHRNVLGHGHDGADAPGGAFVHGVAKPLWRRVDERHIGVLHVGDAIEERKSLHGLAAAAERDAAHDLRAGGDQARDLTAGVTPGRVDHRDAPRLGVEKWQARERRHARLRG